MRSNLRLRHRREATRSPHLLLFWPPEGTLLGMSKPANDISFMRSAQGLFLGSGSGIQGSLRCSSPQFGSVPLMRLGYGATGLLSATPKPLRVG